MKHIYAIIICSLVLASQAMAQTGQGIISGTITTSDGIAAPGVSIQLKSRNKGTVSNDKGQYEFNKVNPGNYILLVSLVGYRTAQQEVQVTAGQTSQANIRLDASDAQLKEIVVSSKQKRYQVSAVSPSLRLTTPLLETPQNIQVVTNKLLADQQIFDMLEGVTRNVSGATKLEHWDNYAYINMRGSQIAAFRNGMNVQMPWGPLTEDMSMVERIEFVKGPAGFMMANGEPSGFYNVVTKKPTGITKGEAAVTVGSFDTYRATVDLDGKLEKKGKLLYRLNLMGQLKGSHRPFDYNNRYTIAPVLMYKFSDRTSLTAEYTYQYSKMAMIGANYVFSPKGYADLPRNFTTAEKNMPPTHVNDHSAFLTFQHQFNSKWKLTAQTAYFNFTQTGSSMWPDSLKANGDMYRATSLWDAKGKNLMGQVFVNGEFQTGSLQHKVLAGIDVGRKQYIAAFGPAYSLNGTKGPFNIYHPEYGNVPDMPPFDRSKPLKERIKDVSNSNEDQRYQGIYIQDEIHMFRDIVRLTLAGRYTAAQYYTTDTAKASQFTPRIGLSVSIDKNTSVYALYDQAFVPQAGRIYPNKSPKPLIGENIEFGIKRDWFQGRWNSTVSAYRIRRKNQLVTDPEAHGEAGLNYSLQLGQSETKGVEADIRGEILPGLNLTLNYAFTESKITRAEKPEDVGNPVPGFAKHNSNGWLSYRLGKGALKGVGVAAGYQFLSDRSTWAWAASNQLALPDYFRLDGAVSWQNNKYAVSVNVNNILNKYLYSGSPYGDFYYWQSEPGTNFRASVAVKF
ncbi:TonB-dependent receptor [Chitinophaga nivalis]|uniref:TonB-dependent receptor n=1 Tax=Chitinophaga nivalis TaxID=2991709 RepID=A0ABT3IEN5_9BACT|nr:TonB-dependent receptor [Chitinophaga nivalis]MCW3467889.1 TonB-dependent receptor [Chitinophaga nivalis]MCW3482420.1 TonB-dependent receptor [Chitinophaga nivalis]